MRHSSKIERGEITSQLNILKNKDLHSSNE